MKLRSHNSEHLSDLLEIRFHKKNDINIFDITVDNELARIIENKDEKRAHGNINYVCATFDLK